jgi:ATP/maltotriose-dependent transcriptional regulator MalT
MLSLTPLAGLRDGYLEQARELAAKTPSLPAGIRERMKSAEAFAHISFGKWEEALTCLGDMTDTMRYRGASTAELFALSVRGRLALCRGEPALLRAVLARMEEVARRFDSAHYLCLACNFHSILALYAGEFEHARRIQSEADAHMARSRDLATSVGLGIQAAWWALRTGDADHARLYADAALKELQVKMPVGNAIPDEHSWLVETYLSLWTGSQGGSNESDIHRQLRQALAELRRLSILFPICRSRAFLWHGRYAALRGQKKLGEWLVKRALAAALHYRMPVDEGFARHALAELAEANGDFERAHKERRQAIALFEQTSAHYYRALASR